MGDPTGTLRAHSSLVEDAFDFASEAHAGQRRKTDGAPYVRHPIEVAMLLSEAGLGETVVAAALLHDVVEDTTIGLDEIEMRFGPEVAKLVGAMTDDAEGLAYEDRKAAHRAKVANAGPAAGAIFAADKLALARDLRAALLREGSRLQDRFQTPLHAKAGHYTRTLDMLERQHPGLPLLPELRQELQLLRRQVARLTPAPR